MMLFWLYIDSASGSLCVWPFSGWLMRSTCCLILTSKAFLCFRRPFYFEADVSLGSTIILGFRTSLYTILYDFYQRSGIYVLKQRIYVLIQYYNAKMMFTETNLSSTVQSINPFRCFRSLPC